MDYKREYRISRPKDFPANIWDLISTGILGRAERVHAGLVPGGKPRDRLLAPIPFLGDLRRQPVHHTRAELLRCARRFPFIQIHRFVGMLQQLLSVGAVVGEKRDAYACPFP
jgi:hypothetical protein